MGEDVARLVRVLFRHIFAVKDGDELCPAGRGLVGKTAEQRGNITVGTVKLPVEQRKIVALVNVETVEIGVARGVGDLRGGNILRRVRHCLCNGVSVAHVGIDRHHRAYALRNGGGGNDNDVFLR